MSQQVYHRTAMFLDHKALKRIGALRRSGELDRAERLLRAAEPSPAVLDELRKIASVRAHTAKKVGDWAAVVRHLEGYIKDAAASRGHCLQITNSEPPPLSNKDQALLQEARGHE